MKTLGRWSAVLVVAAGLLASACTTQTSKQGTSGSSGSNANGLAANNDSASSTVGISDDQINIAFIGVDFSALASTGLVPDLGDQQKQVQSIVDEINANGGINGRKINLHFKLLDVPQRWCRRHPGRVHRGDAGVQGGRRDPAAGSAA